jgi:RNA polymerase sigma factor (sigma-70 family)
VEVFVSLEFLRSRVPADLLEDLALLLGFCFDCAWDYDEFVSVGLVGLSKAVSRFNPAKGVKFSTYAYAYIEGSMRNYVRDQQCLRSGARVDDPQNTLSTILMTDLLPAGDDVDEEYTLKYYSAEDRYPVVDEAIIEEIRSRLHSPYDLRAFEWLLRRIYSAETYKSIGQDVGLTGSRIEQEVRRISKKLSRMRCLRSILACTMP